MRHRARHHCRDENDNCFSCVRFYSDACDKPRDDVFSAANCSRFKRIKERKRLNAERKEQERQCEQETAAPAPGPDGNCLAAGPVIHQHQCDGEA